MRRLSLIKWLKAKLKEDDLLYNGEYGEHTGDVRQNERDEALTKKIILATYQKAKEGLDVPELDTILLATPVSDVIQPIGRIMRELPDKKTPMVIDIWDMMEPFSGSGYIRRKYYKKEGFIIQDM